MPYNYISLSKTERAHFMVTCNHFFHQYCFAIIICEAFETKPLGVLVLNVTATYQTMVTGIASRIIPAMRPPINAPAVTPPELLVSVELSHEGVQT